VVNTFARAAASKPFNSTGVFELIQKLAKHAEIDFAKKLNERGVCGLTLPAIGLWTWLGAIIFADLFVKQLPGRQVRGPRCRGEDGSAGFSFADS